MNLIQNYFHKGIAGTTIVFLAMAVISCAGPRYYSSNSIYSNNPDDTYIHRSDEVKLNTQAVLHVGTQNLLHDFPKFHKVEERFSRLIEKIRTQDLDIIGLQEASWIAGIGLIPGKIAEQLGYHYIFYVSEGAGRILGFLNGMAIISRYPIMEQEILTFRHQRGLFERRSVIRALILTPYGPVNFYSAHLSGATDLLNLQQTRELTAFIGQHRGAGPSLITGDFNFHADDSAQRHLAESGFVDTFTLANPERKNESCCTCIEASYFNSFDPCPEQTFLKAIDRIYFVSNNVTHVEVLKSEFIMNAPFLEDRTPLWISDHKGIRSQIRFRNQGTSNYSGSE